MHKLLLPWLAAVMLLGNTAAAAAASGSATATLAVSASVSLTCAIITTPVNFGPYDPSSRSATEATGMVMITCTQGAICDIGLNAGSFPLAPGNVATRRMKLAAFDHSLPYALFTDSARATLWGNQRNSKNRFVTHVGNGRAHEYPVYGRIAAGQFVPAGLYADTVIATLTYH